MVDDDGIIHTVAGTNEPGDGPDDVRDGTSVALNEPNGLFTMPDGETFILDTGNGKIRKLTRVGKIRTVILDPDGITTGRGLRVSPDQTLIYCSSGDRVPHPAAPAC